MQASNARQHAHEVADLHRQLQAAQAEAAAADARAAAAAQVRRPPQAGCSRPGWMACLGTGQRMQGK